MEENFEDLLKERDWLEEKLDALSEAIGKALGLDFGEHSNMNSPWSNALEAVEALEPKYRASHGYNSRKEFEDALCRELNNLLRVTKGIVIEPTHSNILAARDTDMARVIGENEDIMTGVSSIGAGDAIDVVKRGRNELREEQRKKAGLL